MIILQAIETHNIQVLYWVFGMVVLGFNLFSAFQSSKTRGDLASAEMRLMEKFSEKLDIKLEKQKNEIEKSLEKYALKETVNHLERKVDILESKLNKA